MAATERIVGERHRHRHILRRFAADPRGDKVALHEMRNDVRTLRTAGGLSQQQLAQAMDVSRQTINSIEKERYTPSLPLAIALARFFGKTVEEVFHADDN
jgi:putative transcriptional regulator